jgi:hypothetical protein
MAACWFTSSNATQPGPPTLSTSGQGAGFWTQLGGSAGADGGTLWKGKTLIGIVPNAPAISSGTATTFSYASGGNGGTKTVEFALFEFSGVSQTAGAGGVDNSGNTSGAASTPNPGNLTTTASDLLVAIYAGETGLISAGSGYALGPNPVAVQFGQVQYALNVTAGTIATAFSGGTETQWGAAAIAFLPSVPSSSGNNSYGFYFG